MKYLSYAVIAILIAYGFYQYGYWKGCQDTAIITVKGTYFTLSGMDCSDNKTCHGINPKDCPQLEGATK